MAGTTRARMCMEPTIKAKRRIQTVTLLRFSIWVAFLTYLTCLSVIALHLSGYDGGFGSGRTVYKVNISTGEIAVERTRVVGRK